MPTEQLYRGRELIYRDPIDGPARGQSIWERKSCLASLQDPAGRVRYRQDFNELTIASNTIGGWAFTSATSGSIAADTTNPNGVVQISAGAATANQGVNWQANQVAYRLHATRPLLFEARLKIAGLANLRVQALLGLFATSTALIASGALANVRGIGFAGVTTTGVLAARSYDASAQSATGRTIANDTYYRFGIVATTAKVEYFVDGVKVSEILSQIPAVALAPAFVCQANGTDTPVMHVDYLAIDAPRA